MQQGGIESSLYCARFERAWKDSTIWGRHPLEQFTMDCITHDSLHDIYYDVICSIIYRIRCSLVFWYINVISRYHSADTRQVTSTIVHWVGLPSLSSSFEHHEGSDHYPPFLPCNASRSIGGGWIVWSLSLNGRSKKRNYVILWPNSWRGWS